MWQYDTVVTNNIDAKLQFYDAIFAIVFKIGATYT